MHHTLAALFLALCLGAAARAEQPADYRTVITPVVKQSMDRQRYMLATAQTIESRRRWKRVWIASWAAFAVANVLDSRSSAGKLEANPFLRRPDGTFATGRATALKAGAGVGLFAYQAWAVRKSPEKNLYKGFTVVNSAAAGGLAVIAARNSTR